MIIQFNSIGLKPLDDFAVVFREEKITFLWVLSKSKNLVFNGFKKNSMCRKIKQQTDKY